MNELPFLEHALYGSQGSGGYHFLAQSSGFSHDWLVEAERLCTSFGERPASVPCPRAVFARPFGRHQVAIVQVSDQGADDRGRPGALAFYLVVLPADLYGHLGGDPFYLAERLPPPWSAHGVLSPLACPPPPERRTVAQVREVLQGPNSATLFGGTQGLLDGGRLAFERPAPDEELLRGLWLLLPASSRQDLWPASFAFGNALEFDVLVVPRLDPTQFPGYMLEDHAGDYPEGQYELALQTAAEAGDQEGLDALFARRSYKQTRQLALFLLAIIFLGAIVAILLKKPGHDDKERPETPRKSGPSFDLPKEGFHALDREQRSALTTRLRELADDAGARIGPSPAAAAGLVGSAAPGGDGALRAAGAVAPGWGGWATAEQLLHALDLRLGTPHLDRRGSALRNLGPVERQLRGLLFKHAVKEYNDRRFSAVELVDILREELERGGRLPRRRR